jgi:acyl-CoA hydrolase
MDYQSKVISVEKALSLVKNDDHIVSGLAPSEGAAFLSQLHTLKDKVKNVTVTTCLPMGNFEYMTNADCAQAFNQDGWFFTPVLRKSSAIGNVSYVPQHLSSAAIKRIYHIKPTIYIGNCSMPDKHGFVSLGLSNTYEKSIILKSDLVILEINPNVPRTFGDVELSVKDVSYFIETDYPLPEIPDAMYNEKDFSIGKNIADYILDGDCIQLGIGGIPNAVAASLYEKKHLGVHTELFSTGMMKLTQAGVIDNSVKNFYRGKAVTTMIIGTRELYDFVDDNPGILVMEGKYTNDYYVIGKNDNMVSINTTLEIDLTGQCCSESLGSLQFSGSGGQADTAIGAQMSKNGRSFIALYSTTMAKNPDGSRTEISKIVPQLKRGAAVTLSRNDVHYVVTEYGVADLRGTNVRERVNRLVGIAHPKFREELLRQAHEVGLIAKKAY